MLEGGHLRYNVRNDVKKPQSWLAFACVSEKTVRGLKKVDRRELYCQAAK